MVRPQVEQKLGIQDEGSGALHFDKAVFDCDQIVKFGGGGLGLLLAVGTSFLIMNILTFPRSGSKPLRRFSSDHFMRFVRYGLPFSLGALAFSLHSALDRLSIAFLLGQTATGYYGLAADVTRQLIAVLAASVASAMFPMTFRSVAANDPNATRERLKEGAELLLALIAPVAVWLAISADVVAGALFGIEFQAAVAALLPLLAIGRMCGAVNQYYLQVSFQLAEKPLYQVAHDSLILTLNIGLLFPLTRAFGLPGCAAAVLIAEGLGIMIGIWLSWKTFRLPFDFWGIARVFSATAIMAMSTYAVKVSSSGHGLLTLVAAASAGGVAYCCAATLFNVASIRSSIGALLRPRLVAAE